MTNIRIAVVGAAGRMGRTFIRMVLESPGCELAGVTEHAGSEAIGQDAGELAGLKPLGLIVTDDPLEVFARSDAILDFTIPEATISHAALAAQARIVHVIGTTGLRADDHEKLAAAARHATIIQSGNMSLGVNLLAAITRQVAQKLDEDWDIEVVEMHHRHKVDAPSGTALLLGEAAALGREIALDDVRDSGRDGHTGARKRGDIGFAALRGGNVVGEHEVIFAADNERIVLKHIATDRALFARGAMKAALWGQGKGPGLFSMADVLDLN